MHKALYAKATSGKKCGSHRHKARFGLAFPMAGCRVLAPSAFACALPVAHLPRRVDGQRVPAARHHPRQ